MERRRTPIRRAGLAAAALLLVGGLAACSGTNTVVGRPPAATVDGHEISGAELQNLIDANKKYLQAISSDKTNGASAKTELASFSGVNENSASTAKVADLLTQLVVYQATIDELDRLGLKPSKDDEATARDSLTKSVGADVIKKAGQDLVDFSVKSSAASKALTDLVTKEAKPTAEQVQDAYPAYKRTHPLCLGLIFTADEAAANEAKTAVQTGEDFGAVATQMSADAQTSEQGGFAGCATIDQATQTFPADFAKAKAGDLLGPVELPAQPDTGQGATPVSWALIKVVSLSGPTFAQAKAQIEAQITAGTAATDAAAKRQAAILKRAKVTIDSRFGTWNPKTGKIDAPS